MEGPYLSPDDGARGAHPREHVAPASLDDFSRRQDAAGGRIVLVTLAPEVPGAMALDRTSRRRRRARRDRPYGGDAGTDRATRSRAGATLATHLGNGCAQMLPRHPNVIWELLAADALVASFIVDGHHLPPATVKAMVRAKGIGRTILVTDAVAAAGCAPGRYTIGGVDCDARGRTAACRCRARRISPGSSADAGSRDRQHRAVHGTVRSTP